VHLHIAERKGKLKSYNFSHWNLNKQHGGNPRLADVNRMPTHNRAVAGINTNFNIQLIARTPAGVHQGLRGRNFKLISKFHRCPQELLGPL